MRLTHFRKIVCSAMSKRSYCFVGVTVVSVLTVCLLTFYGDFAIQDTFLGTYTDYVGNVGGFTWDNVPGTASQRSVRAKEYRGTGIKTVLLWNTLFGERDYFGEGDVFRDCPVNKCKIFNYRGYLNVEDYDAILFHGNELSGYRMPARRATRQLYVYVNLESPANREIPHEYDREYFNLTMTYRLDSDVPWSYSIIEDVRSGKFVAPSRNADWSAFGNSTSAKEDEAPPAILDVVRGKSKLVTWFVSNCKAKSGRLEYVKELSKHIGVDIYGKCGAFSCNRGESCFSDLVEPDYFFYLSFENSFCDDYVTEKLMNPLWYNVVPVVYGGANYTQFAPPNSYVNALDFESPKELAAYLKYLSQDLRRYQSFLQWKKYYRVNRGTKRAVCTLCEVLHKEKEPAVYSSLSDWYAKDKCPMQTLLSNANEKYATKITCRESRVKSHLETGAREY